MTDTIYRGTDWPSRGAADVPNPMTTAGDMMIAGASGTPDRLAKGADGTSFKMAGGVQAWAADFAAAIASVAVDTTLTAAHHTVLVDATAAARVITLPTAASALLSTGVGRIYTVKKTDVSVNTVTIDGAASETIDGATTQVIEDQYAALTIQSNGTAWSIVGAYTPPA